MQPPRRQHRDVLQIALAPPPVPDCQIRQRGRAFLVRARQTRHHMDRPAATPHQRRLDEIMAQNMPAERLAPLQHGQPRLPGEGGGADHRVMAPIITLRPVPPSDAMRDHRAVHSPGKLLHAGEQAAAVHGRRQRLDQPHFRMALHRRSQPTQGLPRHHAIGVQDQELRIEAAPAPHPIGNIAGLAFGIGRSPPIEQPRLRPQPLPKSQKRRLLRNPKIGIGRVAENEGVRTAPLAPSRPARRRSPPAPPSPGMAAHYRVGISSAVLTPHRG